jgi:ABC-type branched-subunit amino acid transport system ATPase component
MLAIARSLMSEPRLLMLDEPSLGLAPLIVDRILDVIQAINQDGTPLLLVEQNVHRALALATRAYVLEQGVVTLTGAGPALAAREGVAGQTLDTVGNHPDERGVPLMGELARGRPARVGLTPSESKPRFS